MSALTTLVKKFRGAESVGKILGILLVAIILVFGLGLLGGIVLIWGLNLMGLAVPYTLKTTIGAMIVILSFKPLSFGSKEK